MKLNFTKTQTGLLPADEQSKEWYDKLKGGSLCSGEFRKSQNVKFHRKLFALLQLGFDNWQQPTVEVSVGGKNVFPEKNFNRFRSDITILAGFYKTVYRLDGSFRVEPLSLSFNKMAAEDRESLYSKIIDVLLANVYGAEMTREDIDKMVESYLAFT